MQKPEKILVVVLGAAGFLACIIPVWLRPEHYPSDDSYFYLQVASNIAGGFGATFNHITMTNGFHPLWQWCCAGIFYITGGNKDFSLLVVCIIQQLLFLAIIYYLFRLNEFLNLRYWYLAIPILMFYFLSTGLYASEAHLHCLLLLMLTYYFSEKMFTPSDSKKHWMMIGALCGLLFLARLDAVFVIGCFAIAALWNFSHSIHNNQYRYGGLAAMIALILTLPYLLYNEFTFGYLVPISGAIKSTFPHITASFNAISGLGEIAAVAALIGLIIGIFSSRNRGRKYIYIILSSGATLLTLYLYLYTNGNTRWAWYFVIGMVLFSLIFAQFFEFVSDLVFRKRQFIRVAASILLFAGLTLCAAFRSWEKYSNGDSQGVNLFKFNGKTNKKWQIEVAFWLKHNLPAHTNIFIYDWPGMIAYYSDMNILPTDGLISDYDYDESLRSEGIAAYLKQKHVHYWLGQTSEHPDESFTYINKVNPDSSQRVSIYNPLYRTYAGSFNLRNDHLVVDFRRSIPNPILPDLALWKIGE